MRWAAGESRARAQCHCKLIDTLQQLSGVCHKPVKPADGRAFNRSEMSLDEGKRNCTNTCTYAKCALIAGAFN